MEEAQPRTRLYLDLDGVIYPIAPLYETANIDYDDPDYDNPDVDKLHDREWWRKSIVNRLGGMGVEVVMASSWGEMFLGSTMHSPKDILAPTRALHIDRQTSKAQAVAADLIADPAPFVWVDDHLTPSMIDHVRQSTREDLPGLFVKTDSDQGLTGPELDAIEQAFVRQI